MDDEFGHHRVVERADAVAFTHAIVNTNRTTLVVMRCHFETGAIRFAIHLQQTGRRQEVVVRVLSAYPRFDCMAMYT